MHKIKVLLAVAATVSLTGIQQPTEAKGRSGEIIPGKFIVTLRDGNTPESVTQTHGLRAEHSFRRALQGFTVQTDSGKIEKLRKDQRVQEIEPDRIVEVDVTADAAVMAAISATQPAQKLPSGINRMDADLNVTAKINGIDERVNVDVAILDTGIDTTHPDLNIVKSVTFVAGTTTGNDDNGHGTHVAGTVAALDNSIGVVGVAPGARLWAVKVMNSQGSGSLSNIIAGIDYVTRNAQFIKVANMSLGFQGTSSALNRAISNSVNAGVTYVVSAGNSRTNASYFSPANHPRVICVSAVADYDGKGGARATGYSDADDSFADFSNYGAPVDIAAPGVRIYSTYKGNTYASMSGTSMASPHTAGAAALYMATHPAASPAEVMAALQAAGKLQTDTVHGFTGDRDSLKERFLHASQL